MNLRKSKKSNFTIIELLTVIAIIAILMALLLSAIWKSKEDTYKSKARSEMQQIQNAIMAYKKRFGVYPIPTSLTTDSQITGANYTSLIDLIRGENGKKIKFIEGQTTSNLQDPWNANYIIYIDADYSGSLTGVVSINGVTVALSSIAKDGTIIKTWE